ncbi:hypothetical protein ACQ4PT_039721 [Festuca glaucescens]
MDLKRVLDVVEEEVVVDGDEDELASPDAKRRRTLLHTSSMQEAIGAQYMQKHLPKLEPFLRRVVQEEVHNVLIRHIDSANRLPLQLKTNSKRYTLQFQGNLPQTLFTGNRVEAENKQPLRIVLTDAASNQAITSGPLSSMKVELLVLDGDFNADERLEHTEKEFSESIVFEREGKRPLLSGEVIIVLEKGVASVRDISFTDNSSWRSRKFRLGARMSRASSIEERVQEAVSNPFLVKDHRGEVYKKHHPPALADDVWRLEKIGKDGVFHKKLADFGIHTVQDFLRNLVVDQYGLRGWNVEQMWESTVEHARECVLDDKLYSYCSGHGIILLFNCIHEIIGVVVGSHCFSLNALNETQKALVVKLQQEAYRFPNRIVEFKVQSQSAEQSPTAQAPPMPGPASTQIPNLAQGEPNRRYHGLLNPLPLNETLEDVLQATTGASHHHSEPWITNGFDARDPFDMLQFSGSSQSCSLLLSSTGARLKS